MLLDRRHQQVLRAQLTKTQFGWKQAEEVFILQWTTMVKIIDCLFITFTLNLYSTFLKSRANIQYFGLPGWALLNKNYLEVPIKYIT